MDSQGRVGLGAVPLPWSLEAQHLTTPCIGYPCVACFCPAPAPPPTPLNQPHWLLNQGQRSDAFLLQQPHTHALGTAFPVVGGYLVEYSPYPLPPGAHGIPIGVWNTTSNSFNVEMPWPEPVSDEPHPPRTEYSAPSHGNTISDFLANNSLPTSSGPSSGQGAFGRSSFRPRGEFGRRSSPPRGARRGGSRSKRSRSGILLSEDNHCQLCRSNREMEQVYLGHTLRDENGKVSCPILRSLVCTLCSATGDYAHTLKYCPLNNAVPLRLRSHNFDKARAAAAAGLGQAPVSDDVESEDLEMPSDEGGDGKGAAKYLPYLKVKNAVGNYHSLKY